MDNIMSELNERLTGLAGPAPGDCTKRRPANRPGGDRHHSGTLDICLNETLAAHANARIGFKGDTQWLNQS
jgi:hypothetical protein